jgi:hypothetical protein
MIVHARSMTVLALLIALAAPLAAQPPDPVPVRDAMSPAATLIGTWTGDGWMQLGPDRRAEFHGTETVRYHLDDTVVLIEGIHHAKAPAGVEAPVVHHAFAVLSWNPRSGHTLSSWLANGRGGVFPAQLEAGKLTWTMDAGPMGKVRYTSLVEGDTWHDVGERSTDGETWVKFFEMALSRQD